MHTRPHQTWSYKICGLRNGLVEGLLQLRSEEGGASQGLVGHTHLHRQYVTHDILCRALPLG
jgi:hypothetical protein